MQYPVLNGNSKAINLASKDAYSCLYDIVWSFDYAISGNSSTEAGFTIFLTTSSRVLSGGNSGIDLGYSGVGSFGLLNTVKPGISGAVIGVGFDTTGLFAASAVSGSFTRDGLDFRRVNKNSITVRGKGPNFNYNDYSFNVPISTLTSNFKIVESSVKYKTIRARLGNLGRTLYVDYRNNPDEEFQQILERNVSLGLPITAFLHPGISFVTPISSNQSTSIGNIFLKNFHVEGSVNPNLSKSVVADPTVASRAYDASYQPLVNNIVTVVDEIPIDTFDGTDINAFLT